jgi:hypothetical protein
MGDVVPLTGLSGGRARKPRETGVEITPVGKQGTGFGATHDFPQTVRVTLIDRETGKRVGSRVLPWSEFRDAAHNVVLINIAEGVHE